MKCIQQSVFFTFVNPMDDDHGMEETLSDLDKPSFAPYKNTWRTHQTYSELVQIITRSEERIAILSNTITRNRSLQHIACGLH